MGFLTPARDDQEELLDEHDAPRADADRSLVDLRRINRWLGGVSIYQRMVIRLTRDHTGPIAILDLGTGTSDLLAAMPRHRGMRIGLDFKLDHLTWTRGGWRSQGGW